MKFEFKDPVEVHEDSNGIITIYFVFQNKESRELYEKANINLNDFPTDEVKLNNMQKSKLLDFAFYKLQARFQEYIIEEKIKSLDTIIVLYKPQSPNEYNYELINKNKIVFKYVMDMDEVSWTKDVVDDSINFTQQELLENKDDINALRSILQTKLLWKDIGAKYNYIRKSMIGFQMTLLMKELGEEKLKELINKRKAILEGDDWTDDEVYYEISRNIVLQRQALAMYALKHEFTDQKYIDAVLDKMNILLDYYIDELHLCKRFAGDIKTCKSFAMIVAFSEQLIDYLLPIVIKKSKAKIVN